VRDEFIAQERQSRIWTAIARLVTSPYGLLLAFVWGFTEALSWFIVAEMALILFAAAVPRRVMPWAAAVIVGSVLGVLTNAWLTSRGTLLPAPLTTPRMAATAFGQLAAGPSAMMHQALSGIPVKVYARAAQQLEGQLSLAGLFTDARGLFDGIFERTLAHAPSISMTIVLRSVICSRAKRPPTRPMPLFLPARPPNGRCASQ